MGSRAGVRASPPGLLAGLLALGLAGTAEAGLEICNDTDQVQSIAIGYKGDTDWTSEGWWNLDPGACATLVEGDLKKRYYYYFADAPGREFKGQNYLFCVQDQPFTIVGDTGCEDRGFQSLDFREIDTGETATEFTLSLVDNGERERTEETASGKIPGVTETGSGPGGELAGQAGGTQTTTEAPPQETPVTVTAGALDSGIAPGRHGTPFQIDALFQGCEIEDGKEYCGFHADGLKLRAFHAGPTPDELLFSLEDMAVNLPVRVSGDVVERGRMQVAVVVREVVPRPGADSHADLRAALQGDWVDASDARSEITVRGSEIYHRYQGDFTGTRFLRIAANCDGTGGSGPVLIRTDIGDGAEDCLIVDRMGGQEMALMAADGSTTLRFRKLR